MNDCLFCKIARKEIPADIVYEDEVSMAFLDIRPTSEGHTLVIPKAHYADLLDTPADVACRLMAAVQKVAPAVMTGAGATSFNLGSNNGKEAGQVIFHTHLHIIPRRSDDGLEMWHGKALSPERMQEIFAAIKERLA